MLPPIMSRRSEIFMWHIIACEWINQTRFNDRLNSFLLHKISFLNHFKFRFRSMGWTCSLQRDLNPPPPPPPPPPRSLEKIVNHYHNYSDHNHNRHNFIYIYKMAHERHSTWHRNVWHTTSLAKIDTKWSNYLSTRCRVLSFCML